MHTNDPDQPVIDLGFSGPVDRFASVQPAVVSLRGYAGEQVSRTIAITPLPKYPFKITETKARDGRFIRFRLQDDLKGDGRQGFRLFVENTKQDAGNYSDTIILKTDNAMQPEISLPVYGFLRQRSQPNPKSTSE